MSDELKTALADLAEVEEYFDQRQDADCDETGFIPNEEMRMLTLVNSACEAIRRYQSRAISGLDSPEIMYVCENCAEHNPEMCGQYKREDVRFLASANRWLCQTCFEEESDDDWDVAVAAPALAPLVTGRECVAGKALGDGDPQDCGWPFCDCDPATVKVIDGLQECGYTLTRTTLEGTEE